MDDPWTALAGSVAMGFLDVAIRLASKSGARTFPVESCSNWSNLTAGPDHNRCVALTRRKAGEREPRESMARVSVFCLCWQQRGPRVCAHKSTQQSGWKGCLPALIAAPATFLFWSRCAGGTLTEVTALAGANWACNFFLRKWRRHVCMVIFN